MNGVQGVLGVRRRDFWVCAFVFLILWINGSTLGLSDDEAYYWVLAQTPSLGYAFHPPAVAWFITVSEKLFSWILPHPSPMSVRFPAALSTSLILGLALNWLRRAGVKAKDNNAATLVILSFAGFFSLGWMMVPDIPLFLGWTLLFALTWKACFEKASWLDHAWIGFSAALILLSKYSGILAIASSAWAVWLWTSKSERWKIHAALALGSLGAAIPILIWNSQHEWGSILYQIRDRHSGGEISWIRFARFWLVEAIAAGPVILIYAIQSLGIGLAASARSVGIRSVGIRSGTTRASEGSRSVQYCLVWMIPAAFVFCLQPLFSDFKPHWALVVWWPAALALASSASSENWKWLRYQVGYGLTLSAIVLLSFHVPVGTWILHRFGKIPFDPRLDVTNDLYGWSSLGPFVQEELLREGQEQGLPIVGSRYQTAAQASFSLASYGDPTLKGSVTLFPKTLKERDEWPELGIARDEAGKVALARPIFFVADNRYDAPPPFSSARCRPLKRIESKRGGSVVRWIDLWRCDP